MDVNIHLKVDFKCDAKCEEIFTFFDIVFSGLSMIFSIIISLYFANKHLSYYSNPFFQDKIISNTKRNFVKSN